MFFTGEWTHTAFEGELVAPFSIGDVWKTTRAVAEVVVAEQIALIKDAGAEDWDTLHFEGDVLVHTSPTCEFRDEIHADEDGFYQMPEWTWYGVEEINFDDEINKVVHMDGTEA